MLQFKSFHKISVSLLLSLAFLAAYANTEILVFYNQYCGHCSTWMQTTGNTYTTDAPAFLGEQYPIMRKYDLSKPNGTPRKVLDISLAKKYGWKPKSNFKKSIMETYNFFLEENAINKNKKK